MFQKSVIIGTNTQWTGLAEVKTDLCQQRYGPGTRLPTLNCFWLEVSISDQPVWLLSVSGFVGPPCRPPLDLLGLVWRGLSFVHATLYFTYVFTCFGHVQLWFNLWIISLSWFKNHQHVQNQHRFQKRCHNTSAYFYLAILSLIPESIVLKFWEFSSETSLHLPALCQLCDLGRVI